MLISLAEIEIVRFGTIASQELLSWIIMDDVLTGLEKSISSIVEEIYCKRNDAITHDIFAELEFRIRFVDLSENGIGNVSLTGKGVDHGVPLEQHHRAGAAEF